MTATEILKVVPASIKKRRKDEGMVTENNCNKID